MWPTDPLGGWYPQAVFFGVEATDLAELCDEVDVFFILGLLTLATLVLSEEVEEAAGEHEVPAGVRGPVAWDSTTQIIPHSAKENKRSLIFM